MNDYLTRYYAELEQRKQQLPVRKQELLTRLREAGIVHAYAEYDGSGDSGQVDTVYLYASQENLAASRKATLRDFDNDWQRHDAYQESLRASNEALEEAVSDFVYDLLECEHAGWEINEGSQGNVTIDVAEGTVILNHSENEMTTYDSTATY